MLIGLTIRDVVLIEALDLALGEGLTALTGEPGAGKSIVLDALGLATGARAEAGMIRRGAAQASAAAVFAPAPNHPVWTYLEEKGLPADPAEDLVLRRQLSADGRSRAFVNDQAASVTVLREIGAMLLEVHGQHETVGLLDPKTHRALLDGFGDCGEALGATEAAWAALRTARAHADAGGLVVDEGARAAVSGQLPAQDQVFGRIGRQALFLEIDPDGMAGRRGKPGQRRTSPASARAPVARPRASRTMDFPAPVSPVRAVMPSPRARSRASISTTSRIVSPISMARPKPSSS